MEYINLSRNLIREIMPGTFLGMANLKGLDFSVNVVRKVRHIDVAHLWLQEKQARALLSHNKIWGERNPSDCLTKFISKDMKVT